jgi:hypothetical protein
MADVSEAQLTDPELNNPSLDVFGSALLFNAAVGSGFIIAFLVIRNRFPGTYAPRTFLVPKK